MPIQTNFRAAIERLAELAGSDEPGYVSIRAATQLANLLSPANPGHGDIMHALNDDKPQVDRAPASDRSTPPTEHPYACYVKDDEQSEEDEATEDDESEGAAQDDEPP